MKLKVTGMTCGHCEMAVRKALESLEGIAKVIDISREQERVELEATTSAEVLIAAITEQGFEAEILS